LLGATSQARAAIGPERAGADARTFLSGSAARFCSAPPSRLGPDARRLCPLADVAGCEPLARACAEAAAAPPEVSRKSGNFDWLAATFGRFARAALWLMFGGLAAFAIALAMQAFRRARADRALADARPQASATSVAGPAAAADADESDAARLLGRAAALREAGRHEHALYIFLQAALAALDARRAIRLASGRTYGEYVRECREPSAREPLRELVREVDRVKFGGAAATSVASGLAAERAGRLVRAAATLAALTLALAACGSHERPRRTASDPAGTEVLEELLSRQGVTAGPLVGALARLPMPSPGAGAGRAVLVDLERTPIDEPTARHLIEWAREGGVLVLLGRIDLWPAALGATSAASTSVEVTTSVEVALDDDEPSDPDDPRPRAVRYAGRLAAPAALSMDCGPGAGSSSDEHTLAWTGDGVAFASVCAVGAGAVVGVASDDVFTNIGLMHPGNAEVAFAIVARSHASDVRIAQPMDGIAPPSSPAASLARAGLGVGMWHALAASLLLFWSAGVRLSRAADAQQAPRRAFVEHVEATGFLYARAGASGHALTAFARFAVERLRAAMPRAASGPVAFLAQRSAAPFEDCDRLCAAATSPPDPRATAAENLAALRRLTALYVRAMRRAAP
jgi:hypothetical protein